MRFPHIPNLELLRNRRHVTMATRCGGCTSQEQKNNLNQYDQHTQTNKPHISYRNHIVNALRPPIEVH